MPPVVTLSTGLDGLSADSLFVGDRAKLRKNPGLWPRVRGKSPVLPDRPQQEHHVVYESEAELIESARNRRARAQAVRKPVSDSALGGRSRAEDPSRSPSPVKRGVGAARDCHMGIRRADVVGYKIVNDDADDMHAEFRISVQMDRAQWTMHRRFNDFCDLHQMLVLQHPQCAHDVSLPPKRYFKRNKFDPAYLERRGRQLDAYLRELLAHELFARSVALRDFMSPAWRSSAVDIGTTAAESTGLGERGGGGGAGPPVWAGGEGSVASLTGLTPRQIKFAVFRQQSRQPGVCEPASPSAKSGSAATSCASQRLPLLHVRVRQLRMQPDFELVCALAGSSGTPSGASDTGDISSLKNKIDACEYAAPSACRDGVLPPNTVPWVDDTALA